MTRLSRFAALALLAACGSSSPSFLALDRLCPTVAEEICNARGLCCPGDDDATTCQESVAAACESQIAPMTKDASLAYDATRADRIRDEQQTALLACKDPFPVARFFEHVKKEGQACERDTQCESQSCDPDAKHCTAVQGVALCAPLSPSSP